MLRSRRRKCRLSQLQLALAAGVSQRHLSFLESGRAQPSRAMILLLSQTLEVPLRDRNSWLVSAGFAPVFPARSLDDPRMAQVLAAVRLMLANHAPFPALAVDRAWNIRLANPPFERLADLLGADLWSRTGGPERNLLRAFFHPGGLRPLVANWSAIAPLLWHRAVREAATSGGETVQQLLADLAPYQDAATLSPSEDNALLPVLPVVLEKDGLRLSLFTVISTFGTAQDITAEEIRIESFFPADDTTSRFFREAGG